MQSSRLDSVARTTEEKLDPRITVILLSSFKFLEKPVHHFQVVMTPSHYVLAAPLSVNFSYIRTSSFHFGDKAMVQQVLLVAEFL